MLSLPKIGCGLDQKTWDEILNMIKFIFYDTAIHISVYTGINTSIGILSTKEQDNFEPIWDINRMRIAQEKDDFCRSIKIKIEQQDEEMEAVYYVDQKGLLFKADSGNMIDQIVVPKKVIKEILENFHDIPIAGHQGQEKTYLNIKRRFYWPGMKADIKKYCSECHSCNQRKTSPHLRKAPLQHFTSTCEPWELTSMDIVGPLITSYRGNRYLLTFQDYFTKYPEAIPLPDCKAETVARAFVENIVTRHGAPKKLITDQGSNFLSSLFKEVCKLLHIKKIQTSSYAPTSNGQIERMHRVLKDMLAHYVSDNQQDWDEWIPYVLMAYRGSVHTTTGYSPFFLLHGREQMLPTDTFIKFNRVPYDCTENYVSELVGRLKRVYEKVYENTERVKDERITRFNKKSRNRSFVVGDLVYLKDLSVKVGISKKLTKPWKGPYCVVEIIGPVTYKIRELQSRKETVVHVNRLKPYPIVQRDAQETDIEGSDEEVEDEEEDYAESDKEDDDEEAVEQKKVIFPQWMEHRRHFEVLEEEMEDTGIEDSETENVKQEDIRPAEVPLRRSNRIRRPPDRLNL